MPAEVLNHATLSALFRYWDEKRGGRALPARRDIDPIEMGPRLLPHLMLCELADRGSRIRFRLVGTLLVKRLGYDPTGKWLADLPKSDYLDFLARMVRLSFAEAAPIFADSTFRWGAKGQLDAHHLLLPLTTDNPEGGIVMVGTAYVSEEVFPPQICQLDKLAHHSVGKREILSLKTTAPAWREVKTANVA
jgi:hypothetical protein